MQSSTSNPGQIAAAIASASARNKAPVHSPAALAHGHEEGEPAPVIPVGELLDQLTGQTHGAETATPPG